MLPMDDDEDVERVDPWISPNLPRLIKNLLSLKG